MKTITMYADNPKRHSVEHEIERWLKGEYSEKVDCPEDQIPREHLWTPMIEAGWFTAVDDGGWEDEVEPMLHGLSDDDLDYLTVHTIEELEAPLMMATMPWPI